MVLCWRERRERKIAVSQVGRYYFPARAGSFCCSFADVAAEFLYDCSRRIGSLNWQFCQAALLLQRDRKLVRSARRDVPSRPWQPAGLENPCTTLRCGYRVTALSAELRCSAKCFSTRSFVREMLSAVFFLNLTQKTHHVTKGRGCCAPLWSNATPCHFGDQTLARIHLPGTYFALSPGNHLQIDPISTLNAPTSHLGPMPLRID